ncbi:signal peptidase I [Paenibacillus sp. UNC499MF]|uniref:signal peptidase I n=1 Tax=Paenibacillus sp. UNC499MF TaxID=1502751 RepID=UPI00089FB519|nr:signal peptidase I [Paenibacillus sp. UNC499MF]SEG53272.1 signal peptidase I [Paenibacillus sp. UNC499MF]
MTDSGREPRSSSIHTPEKGGVQGGGRITGKRNWSRLGTFVVIILAAAVIQRYGFNISAVRGISMEPTLHEGQRLFVNKTVSWTGGFSRGDVVVLREPDGTGTESKRPYLVKRIVAAAGDKLEITDGRVFVNGEELKEPYTDQRIADGDYGPFTVGTGYCFVMGDNRRSGASLDSRSFGPAAVNSLVGRAEWIIWPPEALRGL